MRIPKMHEWWDLMALVKYARYREYEAQRIIANDSMMGLLAGAKLAAHTLTLTEGSKARLAEIFPNVDHIERFNLQVAAAKYILDHAENYLGTLAIPYALAIHEDLVMGMLQIANSIGLLSNSALGQMKSNLMHEELERLSGGNFTTETLELFHLVRLSRNAQIHAGGVAGSPLVNQVARTSVKAFSLWKDITHEEFPRYVIGDRVELGLQDLIGVLAITKRLAEEANQFIQKILARTDWADMVVTEWLAERKPGNANQLVRQARGVARRHYGPLALSHDEIADAIKRAGIIP